MIYKINNMIEKQKAVSILNDSIKLTYDCKTLNNNCSMNCGIGVCKAQIIDAKRISELGINEVIQEIVFNKKKFVKIKSLIGDENWYQERINYWNKVKECLKNI